MKPIRFLTREEIETAYAKAVKNLPLPEITECHERHIVECMVRENAARIARNIVGRFKDKAACSKLNLEKDAKNRILAWRDSERWRLWLQSVGATFCERRQRWITTNL